MLDSDGTVRGIVEFPTRLQHGFGVSDEPDRDRAMQFQSETMLAPFEALELDRLGA